MIPRKYVYLKSAIGSVSVLAVTRLTVNGNRWVTVETINDEVWKIPVGNVAGICEMTRHDEPRLPEVGKMYDEHYGASAGRGSR